MRAPETPCTVSVVIPTMCRRDRAETLVRAIDSVTSQREVAAEVLLVVNGASVDEPLLDEIAHLPVVRVVRIAQGSLPAAIARGREEVRGRYFCFLDDDDELLAGSLRERVAVLEADEQVDAVVSNGYRYDGTRDELLLPDLQHAESEPMLALLRRNWLASCAALFRTSTVPGDPFARCVQYREWTTIGFLLLAGGCRFRFVDQPLYRIYHSPQSESKSLGYLRAEIPAIEFMLAECEDRKVRRLLKVRRTTAYHSASDEARVAGDLGEAWSMHVRSLLQPGGWRHLPYTRHLLTVRPPAADATPSDAAAVPDTPRET